MNAWLHHLRGLAAVAALGPAVVWASEEAKSLSSELRSALSQARGSENAKPLSLWELIGTNRPIVVVQVEGRSVVRNPRLPRYGLAGGLHASAQSVAQWRQRAGWDCVEAHRVRVLEKLRGESRARFLIQAESRWEDAMLSRYPAPKPFEPFGARAPEILILANPRAGEPYRRVVPNGRIALQTASELETFRAWIADALALQRQHGAQAVPDEARTQWLVWGAARRPTRHLALQMLGDLLLTREQQRTVMEGFVREPTADDTFVRLLSVVSTERYPAFDRVALGVVKTVMDEPWKGPPLWSVHVLPKLMKRLGLSDAEQREVTGRSDGSIFPTKSYVRAAWAALETHPRFPRVEAVPRAVSVGSADSLKWKPME